VAKLCWKRWGQLHTPLHSIAHLLDPEYSSEVYHDPSNQQELYTNFHDYILKHYNIDDGDLLTNELASYKEGFLQQHFPRARNAAKTLPPHRWWALYGHPLPLLSKLAQQVLMQPTSASSCERNWSLFDFILSTKRNRLKPETFEKLVTIKSNETLYKKCLSNIELIPWVEECVVEEESLEDEVYDVLKNKCVKAAEGDIGVEEHSEVDDFAVEDFENLAIFDADYYKKSSGLLETLAESGDESTTQSQTSNES